jgi:hypothetical protein
MPTVPKVLPNGSIAMGERTRAIAYNLFTGCESVGLIPPTGSNFNISRGTGNVRLKVVRKTTKKKSRHFARQQFSLMDVFGPAANYTVR